MMNCITLVGRIIDNPSLKINRNGKHFCNITLAVTRSYKNYEGIYDTDFINCRLYGSVAETTCEYCRKGDLIGVKGSLSSLPGSNSYVIANKVTYLAMGSKGE